MSRVTHSRMFGFRKDELAAPCTAQGPVDRLCGPTGKINASAFWEQGRHLIPRDLNGGGLRESAARCWFEKAPASEYGAEAGEREWTLATDWLVRAVGT